jgi:hypothetical protein
MVAFLMGLAFIEALVSVASLDGVGATAAEAVAAVSAAAGPIRGKNSCPFLFLFIFVDYV